MDVVRYFRKTFILSSCTVTSELLSYIGSLFLDYYEGLLCCGY